MNMDTSMWYTTKQKCITAITKITNKEITKKRYYKLCNQNTKLPINPKEFFKKQHFTTIENEFNNNLVSFM